LRAEHRACVGVCVCEARDDGIGAQVYPLLTDFFGDVGASRMMADEASVCERKLV